MGHGTLSALLPQAGIPRRHRVTHSHTVLQGPSKEAQGYVFLTHLTRDVTSSRNSSGYGERQGEWRNSTPGDGRLHLCWTLKVCLFAHRGLLEKGTLQEQHTKNGACQTQTNCNTFPSRSSMPGGKGNSFSL